MVVVVMVGRRERSNEIKKQGNDQVLSTRFPGGFIAGIKRLPAMREDPGLIPGWGRPPGEGNGHPPQYSYLENPMDSEAWWATVHGVAKSWT